MDESKQCYIDDILQYITNLAAGDLSARLNLTTGDDEFAAIGEGLTMLAEELQYREYAKENAERRATDISDTVMKIASLSFDAKAPIEGTGDIFDALALGINMLGEELAHSTVSRDYLDNILRSMLDMLIVTSEQGDIRTVNERCKHFGYTQSELEGMNIKDLLFIDDPVEQDRYLTTLAREGTLSVEFARCKQKDETFIPVFIAASAMLTDDNSERTFVFTVKDISEQRRVQEEREKRRMLEIKTDVLRNLNWQKTGISELNSVLAGITESIEFAERSVTFLTKYIKGHVGVCYVYDEKDGLFHRMSEYACVASDTLPQTFALKEGLTGWAAYEQTLTVLNDFPNTYLTVSSALGEAQPVTLVLLPACFEDRTLAVFEIGLFHTVSGAERDFLDEAKQVLGVALHALLSRIKTETLLHETQMLNEELRLQSEELERQAEDLRETNERLETMQETLEKRNKELEDARGELSSRAEALSDASKYKSEFLANMSHELRTPLNSILILSQMLARKDESHAKDSTEYAQTIHDAGIDLLNLINDILDLSKIEAGKLTLSVEDVYPREVVGTLYAMFEPQAKEKDLAFSIHIDEDVPKVIKTDRMQIIHVLRNFISNAIKFTEEGEVSFTCSLATANTLAFTVRDTGIGIPEAKHESIFTAFLQGDGRINRKYGGTGLGLAIADKLARHLKGSITLESNEGRGSTFTLTIPLRIEGENDIHLLPGEQTHPSSSIEYAQNMLIADDRYGLSSKDDVLLIIEDNKAFAEVLAEYGHRAGYKVVCAQDGTLGINYAYEYGPVAIILDIQLPGADGWEVLRTLKDSAKTRHIPVQIVSVVGDKEFGYRLGAINYVMKPVAEEALEDVFTRFKEFDKKTTKTILVVEDNEIERAAIAKHLEAENVSIETARTGHEACDAFHKKHFDCVVLDLTLPDMTGDEVIHAIREQTARQRVPVIVYTAKDLTDEEEKRLRTLSECIILKTTESLERLFEEVSIFLHHAESTRKVKEDARIAKTAKPESFFNGKTLLVVDDDSRNTYALTAALEKNGLVVLTAENGEEGLSLLEEREDVDLVVMDIMMPVMDGYEAIRRIREMPARKDIPIIALTAKAMKGDKEKCMEAGASDYISKPIDYDRFFSLIRIWLAAR